MLATCPRSLGLVCFALGLFLVAGCGGGDSPRTVSGKLELVPKMKLVASDSVSLIFFSEDREGRTFVADVSPQESTFTARVPPGKYKISVAIQPYPGEPGSEKRTQEFESFNNSFSPKSTPLRYEVTNEGMQSITIDVARGSVTKN